MNRYIDTALNLTVGKWWFTHKIVPRQSGNNNQFVLSFDPDDRIDIDRMPWLLDVLKKHGMKASFAAIGTWIEEYPNIWKRVVAEGHEIINHTQTHPDNLELNKKHFHKISFAERKKEIVDCHNTVKRVLGVEMKGFRTPHFGYQHTQDVYTILEELGYTFSSSTLAMRTTGRPFKVGSLTEFPLSYCPKHPWTIFDSSHAFRGRLCNHTPENFLVEWERLIKSGCFLSIYLDPQDLHKFDFETMLLIAKKHGLKTVTYEDLL